jgi:hypothetical protein
MKNIKIGYSAWGFVGDGQNDSPDGGRLTRSLFIENLIDDNYTIIWLQQNRDVNKFNQPLFDTNRHYLDNQKQTLCKIQYDTGYPQINILFLEWRWKILKRNFDVDKSSAAYTPDYDRQMDLLSHYGLTNTQILIWDKDEKIIEEDYKIFKCFVNKPIIISPALYPLIDQLYPRETLLFPCNLEQIRGTKVNKDFDYLIGYVGSQYERDDQLYRFINPFSVKYPFQTIFVGNWLKYPDVANRNSINFPRVLFRDRILPKDMHKVYRHCLSSVLLCKKNYAEHGHITQRIHETTANGVLAIGLAEQKGIDKFINKSLIVSDAYDLVQAIEMLLSLSNTKKQQILDEHIEKLEPFDIKNVMKKFNSIVQINKRIFL